MVHTKPEPFYVPFLNSDSIIPPRLERSFRWFVSFGHPAELHGGDEKLRFRFRFTVS